MSEDETALVQRRLREHGLIDADGEPITIPWQFLSREQQIAELTEIYAGTSWSVTGHTDGTVTWTYSKPGRPDLDAGSKGGTS